MTVSQVLFSVSVFLLWNPICVSSGFLTCRVVLRLKCSPTSPRILSCPVWVGWALNLSQGHRASHKNPIIGTKCLVENICGPKANSVGLARINIMVDLGRVLLLFDKCNSINVNELRWNFKTLWKACLWFQWMNYTTNAIDIFGKIIYCFIPHCMIWCDLLLTLLDEFG